MDPRNVETEHLCGLNVLGVALTLALSFSSVAFSMISEKQSAYVQLKGHTYLSATFQTYQADHFWNSSGAVRNAYNDFEMMEWELYAEYGLTQRDTLSIQAAWGRIEESLNGRVFGFEDVELGWKHTLGCAWGHRVSTQVIGIIPSDEEFQPGLRYGQFGGEFSLLASKPIPLMRCPGHYDVKLGYRFYEGFPSDQLRADYILNFYPFRRFKATTALRLEYGLFNGDSRKDASFFLLNPNYRLLCSETEVTFYLCYGVSLFTGYSQHLWGRNVGKGGTTWCGASLQLGALK